MYHINKILAVAFILLLTGCSIGGEKKIKLFQIEQPREKLNYEMPTPLQLDEIRWIIITSANAEEVFTRLEESGIDPVLFGLTDKGYENLSVNLAKIKQMVLQQKAVIAAYRNYYDKQSVEIEKQQQKLEDIKKEAAKKNKLADEENNKSLTDKLGKGITNIFK